MRPRPRLALPLLLFCAASCVSRDVWQKPERVVDALEIRPGERIADLGSGEGYFVWPLARATGPTGVVYAVDVDANANGRVGARARELGLDHVVPVLCSTDDAELPQPVDLVFTSNSYHHLENHVAYFRGLKRYLRPGARVAIVEFDDESWMRRARGHFTPLETIRAEMQEAGYELVERFDFLSRQSFLVFMPGEGP